MLAVRHIERAGEGEARCQRRCCAALVAAALLFSSLSHALSWCVPTTGCRSTRGGNASPPLRPIQRWPWPRRCGDRRCCCCPSLLPSVALRGSPLPLVVTTVCVEDTVEAPTACARTSRGVRCCAAATAGRRCCSCRGLRPATRWEQRRAICRCCWTGVLLPRFGLWLRAWTVRKSSPQNSFTSFSTTQHKPFFYRPTGPPTVLPRLPLRTRRSRSSEVLGEKAPGAALWACIAPGTPHSTTINAPAPLSLLSLGACTPTPAGCPPRTTIRPQASSAPWACAVSEAEPPHVQSLPDRCFPGAHTRSCVPPCGHGRAKSEPPPLLCVVVSSSLIARIARLAPQRCCWRVGGCPGASPRAKAMRRRSSSSQQ